MRTLQPWRLWLWGRLGREVGGVMVLAFAEDGRLLLVRHSYHRPEQWTVPGGGPVRGESPEATAMREMAEEAGCSLVDAVRLGRFVRKMPEGWTNRIELVAGRISGTPRADGREILQVGLFALAALPPETSPAVHDYVARWTATKGDLSR